MEGEHRNEMNGERAEASSDHKSDDEISLNMKPWQRLSTTRRLFSPDTNNTESESTLVHSPTLPIIRVITDTQISDTVF